MTAPRSRTLNTGSATLSAWSATMPCRWTVSSYTATFASPDVGTGISVTVSGLGLTGADAGNYTLTQPTGLAADITPAALTITANDVTMTYADGTTLNGASGFSASGLQNGETIGSVTLTTDATLSSSDNYDVGTWTITASAASGGTFDPNNYSISYNTGTLTVNPASLTITANDVTTTYADGTTLNGTSGFNASGLAAGETIGWVTLTTVLGSASSATTMSAPGPSRPALPRAAPRSQQLLDFLHYRRADRLTQRR